MAKFIFKMQNILEVKEKLEEQAKSAYALALAKVEEEQQKLLELQEKKYQYEKKLKSLMDSALPVMEIKRLEDAVEIMKYKIGVQQVAVQDAQIKAERARVLLQNAMVERKTYDKLKEKAFVEFKIELNAQEKKEVDELVSYRFGVTAGEET